MYFGRDMPQHILSIYWRQKAARQQRPAFTFVDKKGVNYTLCVLTSWNFDTFIIVHQHNRSSQRPIYGMNTTHALIVSWRQAMCPVVRMLGRVYYIIKVGLCTARFMDNGSRRSQDVERAQWWSSTLEPISVLYNTDNQLKHKTLPIVWYHKVPIV